MVRTGKKIDVGEILFSDESFLKFSNWILWYQERQLRECHGWLARLRVNLWGSLEQFKIRCYQFYLALYWSSLGVVLRLR
jgi:hypothetical protein